MSERMTLAQIKAHNARIASGKRLVKASDFERRPRSSVAPALGSPKPQGGTKGQETGARAGIGPERVLRLVLTGEILGAGKNNLMVCRNGRRVAPERFKVWSRDAIGQILAQVSKIADRPHGCFFTGPVSTRIGATPGAPSSRASPSSPIRNPQSVGSSVAAALAFINSL